MCAAFGLDTSCFTFAYMANYAGESEALKAALERIQGAARRLIEAVEDPTRGGRAVLMAVRKITERRAARAARQLLYHRRLRYTHRAAGGPIPSQEWTYTYEEVSSDRTRLTRTVEGEPGGFFRLADPLIERVLKRQVKHGLETLKDLVEARE